MYNVFLTKMSAFQPVTKYRMQPARAATGHEEQEQPARAATGHEEQEQPVLAAAGSMGRQPSTIFIEKRTSFPAN